MLNRPTWTRLEPGLTPTDRSMAVLQYFVAGLALVAAFALAFTR
jgi:hypothetical protein